MTLLTRHSGFLGVVLAAFLGAPHVHAAETDWGAVDQALSALPMNPGEDPEIIRSQDIATAPLTGRGRVAKGPATGRFSQMHIHIFKRPEGLSVTREFGILEVDGKVTNVFVISSGRAGKATVEGEFPLKAAFVSGKPFPWVTSSKYKDSPMYWGLQIDGGYWMHSTPHYGDLGAPASMGCVRLNHPTAMEIWDLAVNHVRDTAKITIYKSGAPETTEAFERLRGLLRVTAQRIEDYISADLADAHAITPTEYAGNGHWRQDPSRVLAEYAIDYYPSCLGSNCFDAFNVDPKVR